MGCPPLPGLCAARDAMDVDTADETPRMSVAFSLPARQANNTRPSQPGSYRSCSRSAYKLSDRPTPARTCQGKHSANLAPQRATGYHAPRRIVARSPTIHDRRSLPARFRPRRQCAARSRLPSKSSPLAPCASGQSGSRLHLRGRGCLTKESRDYAPDKGAA